jgi:hypothetical protein
MVLVVDYWVKMLLIFHISYFLPGCAKYPTTMPMIAEKLIILENDESCKMNSKLVYPKG